MYQLTVCLLSSFESKELKTTECLEEFFLESCPFLVSTLVPLNVYCLVLVSRIPHSLGERRCLLCVKWEKSECERGPGSQGW